MPPRGRSLQLLAMRKALPIDEEAVMEEPPDWHTLALTQAELTVENAPQQPDGFVVALEDRNSFIQETWRPGLVRFHVSEGEVHVFDDKGAMFHEPHYGVKHGKQEFSDFLIEFDQTRSEYYYRMPKNVRPRRSLSTGWVSWPFDTCEHEAQ